MMQIPEYMELLPASVLKRFSQMRVSTRGLVDGLRSGDHRSQYTGSSTEFAEHREYSPGDDPRGLDWRVYGKMDRYYIKQYVEETNVRVTILLDASASMRFVGDAASQVGGRRMSKYAYGQHLAAAMAYLLTSQGDAVGLVTFDSAMRSHLPSANSVSSLQRLLSVIHETSPEGESKLASVLHSVAQQIPRRGLVIVISDFFEDVAGVTNALHHLKYHKHELILFHVIAEEELHFPYPSATEFHDLEQAGNQLELDPASIRREYLNRLNSFLQQLEGGCGQIEAGYLRLCTSSPYEVALADYLGSRLGRRF